MERGETTAQAVLAVPVLLLFLLLGVQVSMFFNTAAIKSTAEQRASETKPPDVRINNGVIEVKVILHVPSVVPFFTSSVARSASEPLERFVLEVDR
jgi:hypothetical protein